jgi:hypothetical protein
MLPPALNPVEQVFAEVCGGTGCRFKPRLASIHPAERKQIPAALIVKGVCGSLGNEWGEPTPFGCPTLRKIVVC